MPEIVVSLPKPKTPFRLPHIPGVSPRWTKIITATAAVVICFSMISFVVFSVIANNKHFKQSHNLGSISAVDTAQTSGTSKNNAALPGGGTSVGKGGTSGTNSPVVTISATPSSVVVGHSSKLTWSVTNNPSSCTASDDWNGAKTPNGSEVTQPLSIVQSYIFTLTCKTATGTGFATVSVGAVAQGGTGSLATRPTVTLSATPAGIYVGNIASLSWSVTNNPTACTASGDWSGAKTPSAGAETTIALTQVKSYSFTLTCNNQGGTGFATATVLVSSPPPGYPTVSISSTPAGPVTPGTSVQLAWTSINSPTSCSASGDWSGAQNANGSFTTGALNSIKSYSFTITCNNSTGTAFDTASVAVIPNPPSVALTVNPSSILIGNSATLTWSSTNSPTSCTASGDWSGAKGSSGSQSTGTLNTAKTYLYSLTCINAGGSGFVNNVALTVTIPPAPVVTLNVNPISTTVGNSATLTWSATNSPTTCTASGDWSGTKIASGTQNTGTLSTARTYNYSLSCSNAGGSGSASTSVGVSSGVTTNPPVLTISVSPTSIGTGSSSTISWSATNNPTSCTASGSWSGSKSASGSTSTGTMNTAGTYTYTLNCSNSAGSSGNQSATLTVIAIPVVTISLNPSSITTGGSSTISWSATNTPSSCTASGNWSGSKASSGTVTTGAVSPAGSYNYLLSCVNSGGTGSNQATLTVSDPSTVYCAGLSPCYGVSDLAAHTSAGNCWGYNLTWVINITNFRPNHKGNQTGSIEVTNVTCGHDLSPFLKGAASIPGFRDSNNSTTHVHNSGTIDNSAKDLVGYRVGYYDSSKP